MTEGSACFTWMVAPFLGIHGLLWLLHGHGFLSHYCQQKFFQHRSFSCHPLATQGDSDS